MLDFLKKQGYLFICVGLVGALVVALFWAMSIGTVKVPMTSIYNTVMEQLVSGQPIEGADYGPCMISSGCCVCRAWCWQRL